MEPPFPLSWDSTHAWVLELASLHDLVLWQKAVHPISSITIFIFKYLPFLNTSCLIWSIGYYNGVPLRKRWVSNCDRSSKYGAFGEIVSNPCGRTRNYCSEAPICLADWNPNVPSATLSVHRESLKAQVHLAQDIRSKDWHLRQISRACCYICSGCYGCRRIIMC